MSVVAVRANEGACAHHAFVYVPLLMHSVGGGGEMTGVYGGGDGAS